MQVAIFNSFNFHYEMYGYIIYFCKCRNYNITIYDNNNDDYIEVYNTLIKNYNTTYKKIELFDSEKYIYDVIFLTTDDDRNFNTNDMNINNKTISIDHSFEIRNNLKKRIAVRPFPNEYYRDWILPVYPIITIEEKQHSMIENETNIVLLGDSIYNYNTRILNRLKSNNKITIHAIGRFMDINRFHGVANNLNIVIYRNISTKYLINILCIANYVITDVNETDNYTDNRMSGAIPLSIGILTPLIISKQTNKYYNFSNVIEYDKESTDDDINLYNINLKDLCKERDELIDNNNKIFDNFILS
jgi:hypothetical protein